jgi:hypothetical protein
MTKRGPPSWTIRARRMGEMRLLAQIPLPLGCSAALVPYTLPILRFAILPAFSFVHAIRITILAGTVAASVTGPRVCRRHGGDRNHHKHCTSQPGAKHRSFSLTRYRHHNGRGGAGKSRAQARGIGGAQNVRRSSALVGHARCRLRHDARRCSQSCAATAEKSAPYRRADDVGHRSAFRALAPIHFAARVRPAGCGSRRRGLAVVGTEGVE